MLKFLRILALICSMTLSHTAFALAKVIVIGSLHNLHKKTNFTEQMFEEILEKSKPDAILIEFPTDWFDSNNVPDADTKKYLEDETQKDGGRDGQLSWKYCKKNSVFCLPFDIVGRNQFFKKNRVFQRINLFEKEILAYSKLNPTHNRAYLGLQNLYEVCLNQAPTVLNSSACDQAIKLKEELVLSLYREARAANKLSDPNFYQIQWDYWLLRNRTMSDNICKVAEKMADKKVVVVTGVDHRYFLLELLSNCKFATVEDWN